MAGMFTWPPTWLLSIVWIKPNLTTISQVLTSRRSPGILVHFTSVDQSAQSWNTCTTFHKCWPVGAVLEYLYISQVLTSRRSPGILVHFTSVDESAQSWNTCTPFHKCSPVGAVLEYLYISQVFTSRRSPGILVKKNILLQATFKCMNLTQPNLT